MKHPTVYSFNTFRCDANIQIKFKNNFGSASYKLQSEAWLWETRCFWGYNILPNFDSICPNLINFAQ